MSNKQEQKEIVKAIETLTAIADLEVDSPIAVAETHQIELQEIPVLYKTVHWLHQKNAERILDVVRDTYRVILSHIKRFYVGEYGKLIKHKSVEGIRTIMVLVGEAAKKVDKYNRVFFGTKAQSIRESKELKDLVSFYQKKIAPIAAQETLSDWMQQLPQKVIQDVALTTTKNYNQYFLDMDSLVHDSDYELFFIKKDTGHRFFDDKLIRNIKLFYDFDERYVDSEQSLLGSEIKKWKAVLCQSISRNCVRHNWVLINSFFKLARSYKDEYIVMNLYKALYALMLSANQGIIIHEHSKDSASYFLDFQRFLREIVASKDFQHLVAYPPSEGDDIHFLCMRVIEGLCYQVFTQPHMSKEFAELCEVLSIQGRNEVIDKEWLSTPANSPISRRMEIDMELLEQAIGKWHHLSIFNTIDTLKGMGASFGFDAWMCQNLPVKLFDLVVLGKPLSILRIPCPTTQTHVAHAALTEEFKAFIRAKKEGRHLLIDLQDRTSWKDAARSLCLEEIQNKEEYFKQLCVVSMAKDGDFYTQVTRSSVYEPAAEFIKALCLEMKSEKGSFFYPHKVMRQLTTSFFEELAIAVHTLFFDSAQNLEPQQREEFLEFMHFFIQLKLIEIVAPTSLSFTCKDGIDTSSCNVSEFYILLKLFNERPFSEEEEEYLQMVLHTPAILFRGRVLSREKFARLYNCIRIVETQMGKRGQKGFHHAIYEHIAPLYETDMLSSVMSLPHIGL
jgi:hypothetical protein